MDELKGKLGGFNSDANLGIRKAINSGVLLIQSTARRSILRSSKGIKYGRHTSSRPGDAPNKDTGNLITNIRISTGKESIKRGYSAEVKALTPYAMRMEYGGKDKRGIYIAPRPFMRPALQKNKNKIKDMVNSAVRSALGN